MAAPISIRLPMRTLLRSSAHTNPAAQLRRTPCCAQIVSQTQSRSIATQGGPPGRAKEEKPDHPSLMNGIPKREDVWRPTPIYGAPKQHKEVVYEDGEKENMKNIEIPRNVQAAYMRPLRREAEYGIPSCDLQMRSYSIRNLEFFADFAMRAAYYLNLPAYGPIPLPRITERWTVPLGPFIHKKSQENFERKTLRRLIQIKDGNEETVGIWLAFISKHAYYGVGMKANVWSFDKLGVGKNMDAQMHDIRPQLEDTLDSFAFDKNSEVANRVLEQLNKGNFRAGSGGSTPMQEARTQKHNEARPWLHPDIPSDAAKKAVRRGIR